MKITLSKYGLTASQADKSERYYSESALFYAIKRALVAMGFDVIKRRPDRDGHLTSAPYYIRDRKWRFAYADDSYQVYDAARTFREDGEIYLTKHDWSEAK